MAPLGTQRRSSHCLLRSPISVAFANNLLSLPGPQRAPRGSEACSGGSRALSDDYVGPKGTRLLKGAPVLRWVEAGWGMEPMSGQTCPKEKVPPAPLKPALAVSLPVGGNMFISSRYCSHISLSSPMNYFCGSEIKRAVKKPSRTSERTSPHEPKAGSY